mmetsp:Transcript_3239/g.6447  ORF Transcript_3239/g.6447 Transcript_3239/m.6447 type:complete len:281 (-) Transcript_3239:23-865(-)
MLEMPMRRLSAALVGARCGAGSGRGWCRGALAAVWGAGREAWVRGENSEVMSFAISSWLRAWGGEGLQCCASGCRTAPLSCTAMPAPANSSLVARRRLAARLRLAVARASTWSLVRLFFSIPDAFLTLILRAGSPTATSATNAAGAGATGSTAARERRACAASRTRLRSPPSFLWCSLPISLPRACAASAVSLAPHPSEGACAFLERIWPCAWRCILGLPDGTLLTPPSLSTIPNCKPAPTNLPLDAGWIGALERVRGLSRMLLPPCVAPSRPSVVGLEA